VCVRVCVCVCVFTKRVIAWANVCELTSHAYMFGEPAELCGVLLMLGWAGETEERRKEK
jgi:hypothetical protein